MSGKVVFSLTQDQARVLLAIGGERDVESISLATIDAMYRKGLLVARTASRGLTPLGEAALAVAARLAGPGGAE